MSVSEILSACPTLLGTRTSGQTLERAKADTPDRADRPDRARNGAQAENAPATPRGGEVPQVLIPFDKRESMTLRYAAKLAGKSEGTVRTWCCQYDTGRRVAGGPWCVSRVALAMLLDGNAAALAAYRAGDRHGPFVAPYYERLGLGVLLKVWLPSGSGSLIDARA